MDYKELNKLMLEFIEEKGFTKEDINRFIFQKKQLMNNKNLLCDIRAYSYYDETFKIVTVLKTEKLKKYYKSDIIRLNDDELEKTQK